VVPGVGGASTARQRRPLDLDDLLAYSSKRVLGDDAVTTLATAGGDEQAA
jgi:hypothetical protein